MSTIIGIITLTKETKFLSIPVNKITHVAHVAAEYTKTLGQGMVPNVDVAITDVGIRVLFLSPVPPH